jgi:hypothetical protein
MGIQKAGSKQYFPESKSNRPSGWWWQSHSESQELLDGQAWFVSSVQGQWPKVQLLHGILKTIQLWFSPGDHEIGWRRAEVLNCIAYVILFDVRYSCTMPDTVLTGRRQHP